MDFKRTYMYVDVAWRRQQLHMMFLQIMQYIGVSFFWKFELTSYEMYFN